MKQKSHTARASGIVSVVVVTSMYILKNLVNSMRSLTLSMLPTCICSWCVHEDHACDGICINVACMLLCVSVCGGAHTCVICTCMHMAENEIKCIVDVRSCVVVQCASM